MRNAKVRACTLVFVAFAACAVEPSESLSTNTAAISACSPACGGCVTPDPFVYFGGGVCISGGWYMSNMGGTECCWAEAHAPPPPPPVCTMNCGHCTTPDPFVSLGGGTCVNGGWLPPNHPSIGCCVGAGVPGVVICGDHVQAGGEQCDGTACCTSTCTFATNGTACSGGSCNGAGTCVPTPPPPPPSDRLTAGQSLAADQSIVSGTTRLIYQADNNLVLYVGSTPAWGSMAAIGQPTSRFAMQTDCNAVVYSASGAVWNSSTYGQGSACYARVIAGDWFICSGTNRVFSARGGGDCGGGTPLPPPPPPAPPAHVHNAWCTFWGQR